ncbi:MAG: outer membrane beta-barrel protein [Chitinophagales bacterium]
MQVFFNLRWTFSCMLTLFAALLTFQTTQAQTTLGISAEIGAPSFQHQAQIPLIAGVADIPLDLSQNTASGFGASVKLQHKVNDKVAIFGKVGFLQFENTNFGNLGDVGSVIGSLTNLNATVTAIPMQVGTKVYLAEGLYASAEVGAHQISTKLSANLLVNLSAKESFTEMSFAPGVGYEVDLGGVSLDLGARYQMVKGGFNYLGVNVGMSIPLGYTVYQR